MRFFYIVCCVLLMGSGAWGKTRIFTDTKGRSIEAELEKFEESSSTVTIKKAGSRQSMRVPLSLFSEKDQAYIRDWGRLQALHDSRFDIDISKSSKRNADKSFGTYASTEVVYDHCYNLSFENGTKCNLENMDLEYVIYYEQDHHLNGGYNKAVTKNGTMYVKDTISVPARDVVEISTEKVPLVEWKTATIAQIKSDIEGIRIRLTLRADGGAETTREFSYPSKLKYAWTDQTESAFSRRAKR